MWQRPVLLDALCQLVDPVSEGVWSRAAVGAVELQPEVGVWAAGVVGGRQDESSGGLVLPGGGGCWGLNPVLTIVGVGVVVSVGVGATKSSPYCNT